MKRFSTQAKWLITQVLVGGGVVALFFLYYFFFHVPARRAALVERNLRLLAGMSDQVKESIQNVHTSLTNAASKAFHGPRVQISAQLSQSTRQSQLPPKTNLPNANEAEHAVKQALALVVPKLDVVSSPDLRVTPSATPGRLVAMRTEPGLDHGWLHFNYSETNRPITGEGRIGVETGASLHFEVRADLQQLLRPIIARNEFDGLLLVREDGTVIHQVSQSELRVSRFPQLAQDRGQSRAADDAAAGTNLAAYGSSFGEAKLSVRDFKLFSQPLEIALPADGAARDSSTRWVLCGLVRARNFNAQSWALPQPVIIGVAAAALMIFLTWPFLNVWFARPSHPIGIVDVFWVAAASVIGCGALTLLLLDLWVYPGLEKEMDGQLKFLAQDIERNLHAELKAANEQLIRLDEQAACEAYNLTDVLQDETLLPSDGVGTAYPYFSMAWWADTNGQQLFKWTVASNNTPIINLADREYVSAIIDGRAWASNSAVTNGFCLEPLYSRTRGENVAMFSIATRSNKAAVAALELRLVSLVKTVLPAGYGFCVVGDRGQALFHSDEQRNLRENFAVECEDDGQLQAVIAGRIARDFETYYFRRLCQLYVTPLQILPWTLIVFRDETSLGNANLQIMTLSALLFGLYSLALLAALGLIYCLDFRHRWEWLWPDARRRARYVAVIFGSLLAAGLYYWLQLSVEDPARRLFVAGAIPVGAFVVMWAVLKLFWQTNGSCCLQTRADRFFYGLALSSLLVVVTVLPASAIFRAVYEKEMELFVKGAQLHLSHSLQSRAERVRTEFRRLAGGQRIVPQRLKCRWDIHQRFFLATQIGPGGAATTTNREERGFDRLWSRMRPVLGGADLGNRAMLSDAADGSWRWSKTGDLLSFWRRDATRWLARDAFFLQSELPGFFHPQWWWYLLAALALPLPFLLTWFIGRRVFLMHVSMPRYETVDATPGGVLVLGDVPSAPAGSPVSDPFTAAEKNHVHIFDARDRSIYDALPELKRQMPPSGTDTVFVFDRCRVPDQASAHAVRQDWAGQLGLDRKQTLVVVTDTTPGAAPFSDSPARQSRQRRIEIAQAIRELHFARWKDCSDVEKLLLYQVARTGFADAKKPELRALLRHGLVLRDPKLRLADESFRRFVLQQYHAESATLKEADENGDYWSKLKGPLALMLIGLAVFLFLSQRETWNLLVGLVPAFLTGLAAMTKLSSVFRKEKAKQAGEE